MDAENGIDLTDPHVRERIEVIATHVVRSWGWKQFEKEDFIKGAPGAIAERLKGLHGSDPWSWVCKTLEHVLTDEHRRKRGKSVRRWIERISAERQEHEGALGDLLRKERRCLTLTPFSESDLTVIRSWNLVDRLLLLAWTGLFQKVPGDEWLAWCKERGLTKEYPPDGWRSMPDGKLKNAVCDALGMTPNAVEVRKFRWRERKIHLELEYCRGVPDIEGADR